MDTFPSDPNPRPAAWRHFVHSRTGRIAMGVAAVVVVATGIAIAATSHHWQPNNVAIVQVPTSSAKATVAPTPTPTPAQLPSLLNGLMVPAAVATERPLAVMIENHPDARPQYGLGEADIVYEAIAEGGITRFMAVFGNPETDVRVGPVRSARPYYVDFAAELNAFYAHAGGSVEGLAEIGRKGLPDLDGLAIGSPIFFRDTTRHVASEHTLFSSTKGLWQYATATKHLPDTATFQPWLFQADAPAASRPASQTVKVSVAGADMAVVWNYNPADNTYLRNMAGAPHIDAATNKQIAVKTIILQTAKRTDGTEHYTDGVTKSVGFYDLTSGGQAVVIENGVATKGTWKVSGGRTRYYDSAGAEIKLVAGHIWVHVVQSDSVVSY